ncbi:hypothetical protein ACFQHO_30285 [Actinomadura yumaensis]
MGLNPDQGAGFVPVPGAQDPPPAPAVPTITLAQRARSELQVPTPVVHTAPNGKTYVRVRTSLWVDGFVTKSTTPFTVDGQTIQATAEPDKVVWNLGETTADCDDGGSKEGKSCNYTYRRSSAQQPGGSYKITATVIWNVSWTCEGAACDDDGGALGTMQMTSAPTPLTVGEIQTNSRQ